MLKVWNVAIYCRVSTEKKDQQESIPFQKESLKKWLIELSSKDKTAIYHFIESYEDQGFSGSNFDRDSFNRMKQDIEAGKINMILTRDLSRFSRNYVLAGYYIEDYFRINNVRFVCTLDNVDTENEISDIIPFKNILNEMFIKDCSKRIKDALKQRMLRGSSIASKPPYGYKFQIDYIGESKHISLVQAEDETTEVVRQIYQLYLKGWGFGRITAYLNSKCIPTPAARFNNFNAAKYAVWNNGTIKSILTNPKYGGMMVQQRWKKVSYKLKKIILTDKKEHIYGGEFQGIVDKKTFESVQDFIEKRGKNYRYKKEPRHLFTGVLRCKECGCTLIYKTKYEGYKCSTSQKGKAKCSPHSVKETVLQETIKTQLQYYVEKYVGKNFIYDCLSTVSDKKESYKKELQSVEKEIDKWDSQIQSIYEDKLGGLINERNFENLIFKIQKKQEHLIWRKQEVIELQGTKNEGKDTDNSNRLLIDNILNMDSFDRQLIEYFIENITVSEDIYTKKKKIDIHFKFKLPVGELCIAKDPYPA